MATKLSLRLDEAEKELSPWLMANDSEWKPEEPFGYRYRDGMRLQMEDLRRYPEIREAYI